MPRPRLPHHQLRNTPELVYEWFRQELQRRKTRCKYIHAKAGTRYADAERKVYLIFPDGTRKHTYEILPEPKAETKSVPPLLSDLESRINFERIASK